MKRIEVLIATMHQTDYSLLEKMNIQSDAVVGNQCNFNKVDNFEYNGHQIKWLSFNERGVGLNRNNTLMRATADICLFADDDIVYLDDYVEKIQHAFDSIPQADVIVFNVKEAVKKRYVIPKIMKINRFNYMRYGAVRIAIRLESVKKNAIYFNQCFGGGTEHCAGEDNIFLATCFKNGLKVYAIPDYILEITEERESTWFKGYDDKYLFDKGCLYKTISKRWWRLLCLQDAIRHRKRYNVSWFKAYNKMLKLK